MLGDQLLSEQFGRQLPTPPKEWESPRDGPRRVNLETRV